MGHPRWPGYDTKTGNPEHDNAARNANRRMWKDVQKGVRVTTPHGRRRKKQLLRVEGSRYIIIVNEYAMRRYREDHPDQKEPRRGA